MRILRAAGMDNVAADSWLPQAMAGTGRNPAPAPFTLRDTITSALAPASGEPAAVMIAATRRAEEHAARAAGRVRVPGSPPRVNTDRAAEAVKKAVACYRSGGRIPPGDALAWLCLVLRDERVRDAAWAMMLPQYREAHERLWSDLTRLARPGYVAPPATLLAFTAMQSGHAPIACAALDRALSDNAEYRMAQLLRQAPGMGAPSSTAQIPLSVSESRTLPEME